MLIPSDIISFSHVFYKIFYKNLTDMLNSRVEILRFIRETVFGRKTKPDFIYYYTLQFAKCQ